LRQCLCHLYAIFIDWAIDRHRFVIGARNSLAWRIRVGRMVAMRNGRAEPYLRWDPPDTPSDPAVPTTNDLAVGLAHLIANVVMSIAGPLFWVALALGFMTDVLGTDLFR
jgi:hypothetical protein